MIHEFRNNAWLPGAEHRDGSQPFPAQPAPGLFFNDVTGAQGASADAVAEDLPQLLMKQGALADLLPVPFDWPGLMDRIKTTMDQGQADQRPPRLIAEVTLGRDESMQIQANEGWSAALANDAAQLALALVRANGQMDYIRRQAWFSSDTHTVVLMVESEVARQRSLLQWHKDTIGHSLFSNLLFRNEDGFLGTEWTPDLQPLPPVKQAVLSGEWPPALLADVTRVRAQLAQNGGQGLAIEGGTLPANGFMSWVDELVWHSTPVLKHRTRWTRAAVDAVLTLEAFGAPTFDVMAQIVQTPGNRFAQWLAQARIRPEALSYEEAEGLWIHAFGRPEGRAMLEALQQDARAIDWSQRQFFTAWGVSLSLDSPDGDETEITTQPTGMAGRPRRNSADLDALLASEASRQDRDFLQIGVTVRERT